MPIDPFAGLSTQELIRKIGSSGAATGMNKQAVDVSRTGLTFQDPALFDPILFFLQHRDRKELNFRLRYYFEYDSLVGNAISLHSSFPISDFELVCGDRQTGHRFRDWSEDVELLQFVCDLAADYWLLGEAVAHGHWNIYDKSWSYFTMYPPESVDPQQTAISRNPLLYLEVDPKWKKMVNSTDPLDQAMTKMISRDLIDKIGTQNKILLPPSQTVYLANKIGRYAKRGTSILKRCLKPLLYKDKLRLLQFTFVDRHMFPLKIFKLGDPNTGWIPTRSHFEMLRALLEQAANDPDFNLIFHHGLSVDYVGTKDKIENLIPHFEYTDREIMTALFTNEALTHGGGVTYANANVSVKVLTHRYLLFRDMITTKLRRTFLKPMAVARGYYFSDTAGHSGNPQVRVNGKFKTLDVPEIKWNKINFLDDTQQKQMLVDLRKNGRQVPHRLIAEIFDQDPQKMEKWLKDEEGTVADPLVEKARGAFVEDPFVASQLLRGAKAETMKLEPEAKGSTSPDAPSAPPAPSSEELLGPPLE